MEHRPRFSCESQGWFPRKSFRVKIETNNRSALGENALAQSISCLCVSAWWWTGDVAFCMCVCVCVFVMENNMIEYKRKMDWNNGQHIQEQLRRGASPFVHPLKALFSILITLYLFSSSHLILFTCSQSFSCFTSFYSHHSVSFVACLHVKSSLSLFLQMSISQPVE